MAGGEGGEEEGGAPLLEERDRGRRLRHGTRRCPTRRHENDCPSLHRPIPLKASRTRSARLTDQTDGGDTVYVSVVSPPRLFFGLERLVIGRGDDDEATLRLRRAED